MDNINETLNARQSTHGTFSESAETVQCIKHIMRKSPNWSKLLPVQREGLEMIVHKLGRVLHGDALLLDSMRDVIGYAQLVLNELAQTDGATDVATVRLKRVNGEWIAEEA